MVRPLLWSEFIDTIHMHSGEADEDFFCKHIPRSHMPLDYGGDLPSMKELHEENMKNMSNLREYFMLEEQHMMHKFSEESVDT
jgi:hypothetical protein